MPSAELLKKGVSRFLDPNENFTRLAIDRTKWECRNSYILPSVIGDLNYFLSRHFRGTEDPVTLSAGKLYLGSKNPIIDAGMIDDFEYACFVADPFLYIGEDSQYHLFFEIGSQHCLRDTTAVIGHAISDDRGQSWSYDQVVLDLGAHLSYPFVFEFEGDPYMVPEINVGEPVPLKLFSPDGTFGSWSQETVLIKPNFKPTDSVVYEWKDRWWILTHDPNEMTLHGYYADSIFGEWSAHDQNPLVRERPTAVRPGGRPIISEKEIHMFFQDVSDEYGRKVREYRITTLSPTSYEDVETERSPVTTPVENCLGWRAGRSHHIDCQRHDGRLISVVDGDISDWCRQFSDSKWSIGWFESLKNDYQSRENETKLTH